MRGTGKVIGPRRSRGFSRVVTLLDISVISVVKIVVRFRVEDKV